MSNNKVLAEIGKGKAFELAAAIRQSVFVDEQKFSNEFDELDNTSLHVVIVNEDRAVATARAYNNNGESVYHVGRVAVNKLNRGEGLGRVVMIATEEKLKEIGATEVVLSAQCQAEGFYKTLGYTPFGEVYLDEHCPHQDMRKVLL